MSRISTPQKLSKWISFILSNSFFIYEENTMFTESEILARNIHSMTPIYFMSKFVDDYIIVDIEENYKCPKDNYNIILYLSGILILS